MDPRPKQDSTTAAQREMMRVRAAELSLAMQGGVSIPGTLGNKARQQQQQHKQEQKQQVPPACGFCHQLVAMMPDVNGATVMCSASANPGLCNGVSASVQLSFRHFTSGKTDPTAYVHAEAAFRAMAPRVCSVMCAAQAAAAPPASA